MKLKPKTNSNISFVYTDIKVVEIMNNYIVPIVLGLFCVVLGVINYKGNISSVHWYHRQRITEEDIVPFGKMVGTGTAVIGLSISAFGVFQYLAEKFSNDLFSTVGAVIVIIGAISGIIISLYAIIKYNKGIF